MQNNANKFNTYERQIVQDTTFLLAKREIIRKVEDLFAGLQYVLDKNSRQIKEVEKALGIQFQGPKLSKGDNYRGLPYVVLDHPRYFNKEDVCSFRSMFWWGHFFSFTLHLQGDCWNKVRNNLNIGALHFPFFISSGRSSAWEYHYEAENYTFIENAATFPSEKDLLAQTFFKVSRKLDVLDDQDDVLEAGNETLIAFLKMLNV
jgi:hypothetical protein